ncbi:MAG: SIS domain-containing protein [Cyclobacteriaceae bacterium]
MKNFLTDYVGKQKQALDTIPLDKVAEIVDLFKNALDNDKQIFVFGNGGSAANASHFVTDLGKGSSDKTYKRFRCLSLNDNTAWITALGNDYSYEDIFVKQLMNFARKGDLLFIMSVSGNSPNLVKAASWAEQNDVRVIALVGSKKGKLADLADTAVVVKDDHYGRVEDAHMGICHMIAYAFMELTALQKR